MALSKRWLFVGGLLGAALSAKSQNTAPYRHSSYGDVGAIAFDPMQDDPRFQLCDEHHLAQSYQVNPKYPLGTAALQQRLRTAFAAHSPCRRATGTITVRFLISCTGETGRFRVYAVDTAYRPTAFPPEVAQYLLQAIRSVGRWQPGTYQHHAYDSYKFLSFRLQAGQLVTIFP
ncbi:hypothetical protein BXP70_27565 [Hymenobacter crusticola]|uniref:TonB C-terminal domain-containing protein n=2 Tax=Hymenobacter crusticola TaxID=1770526 RepID=A0A243W5W7_9BACT|nr:hypothetical protein BXP70_27565 [Hymenobacter crusticola]